MKAERVRFDQTIIGWAEPSPRHGLPGITPTIRARRNASVTKPCWVLVTHLFNHQTHHRGQVHCMLTQAGGKPSDTDLPFMPE